MAVINAFVTQNASSVAADVDIAARCGGEKVKALLFSFEVAVADDNASIYRIGKIPGRAIPLSLRIANDATAGLTNPSFGIYKPLEVGGALIDVDCLMVATDLNAGTATLTEKFAPAIADVGKDVLDLAAVAEADKDQYASVDVAMTTAAGVSAAGTISGILLYVDGV
jgi:hypothetical protein